MTSAGKLKTMLTWAEDRALLRSAPSADPGAKTGARAEYTSALRSLVDCSTTAPGLAPTRQTFAARCRSPFIYANPTKFHFTVNQDSDAFRLETKRSQRRSDGTISLEGVRYEVPQGTVTSARLPYAMPDGTWVGSIWSTNAADLFWLPFILSTKAPTPTADAPRSSSPIPTCRPRIGGAKLATCRLF